MDAYSDNEAVWESGETVADLRVFFEEALGGGYGRDVRPDEVIELEVNIPWWYDDSVLEGVSALKITGKLRESKSFDDAAEIVLSSVDGDRLNLPFKALSKRVNDAGDLPPDSKILFLLPGFGVKKGSVPATLVDIDHDDSRETFRFTLEIFDPFIE